MEKTITKIYCDVCQQETNNKKIDIQVIFLTEQDEGRCVKPYLCNEKLNLCDNCMNTILDGQYIFAEGAMGCNRYWFEERAQL